MSDINHPQHYGQGPFECIELSGLYDFCMGNAIKYVWRHKLKGQPVKDLRKALWYLNHTKGEHGLGEATAMVTWIPLGGCARLADMLDQLTEANWADATPFWKALEDNDLAGCITAVEQLIRAEERTTPS
ncbi:DUF3310 domain-containing protein [Bifidobacterium oedipodis]|uniref:DUF3310 domain-containing protein n=1 Tax=Bifidobacterium oedipodis TaxID=2675322 RepID=A0A7Y0EP92_9BIFI|nr:DUF3310 domain-containing protein [Bifidobacterium sp. DSM 109957]NMM93912.1 hypothetical protein [Bifidobacterium sp. DSM 109957]